MSSASPDNTAMAMVHEGWDHLRAGRPLAARASWQRALALEDGSEAAQQAIDRLEKSGDLPAAARAIYRLRAQADPARRAAWDDRLAAKQASLQTMYTNLSTTLAKLQSQSDWLASQISGLDSMFSSSKN